MSILSIVVVGILVIAGAIVIALESNAPQKTKTRAVIGLVLMVGTAIFLFLTRDGNGKIDWGDVEASAAEEGKPSKKKVQANSGGEGDQPKERPPGKGGGGMNYSAGLDGGDNSGETEVVEDGKSSNKTQRKEASKIPIVSFQDCDVCPLMVVVRRGTYFMGSPETEIGRTKTEGPQTRVQLSHKIAVSRTEITRRQYMAFAVQTGYAPSHGCVVGGLMDASANFQNPGFVQEDSDPVVCVSWHDAKAYVKWLSTKINANYRLLSEAEWEYVARADTTGPYWLKSRISRADANYDNAWRATKIAGSYPPNPFGIKDVNGNVSEWVEDCWHPNYARRPNTAKAWERGYGGDCSYRVVRGGAWNSEASEVRSAARTFEGVKTISNTMGFRVARSK